MPERTNDNGFRLSRCSRYESWEKYGISSLPTFLMRYDTVRDDFGESRNIGCAWSADLQGKIRHLRAKYAFQCIWALYGMVWSESTFEKPAISVACALLVSREKR